MTKEMDQKTIIALRDSVRKWKGICLSNREDRGDKDCPLCQLFFVDDCDGCPVSSYTGLPFCSGSPYALWKKHQEKEHPGLSYCVREDCQKCRLLAKRELEFLRSLLLRSIFPYLV